MRWEGRERAYVGGKKRAEREREREKKQHTDEKNERENVGEKVCAYLRRTQSQNETGSLKSVRSGQDEMVDCVWTASRKYLE